MGVFTGGGSGQVDLSHTFYQTFPFMFFLTFPLKYYLYKKIIKIPFIQKKLSYPRSIICYLFTSLRACLIFEGAFFKVTKCTL